MTDAKTAALTLLALIAFASNSLLTRLALGTHQIDAAGFTAVRLVAGAVMLVALVVMQTKSWSAMKGTMIGYGIVRGERSSAMIWLGLLLAAAGLALLTVPSVTRPDPLGVLLMAIAGVAWAVYTLVGRGTANPVAANARSFFWSAPLAIALVLFVIGSHPDAAPSARGIGLALVSGAVTSGLGYAIWYRALPSLSVTQAAVAQLSVPVIAALGAVAVLGEAVSSRLVVAGVLVLSGVGLVLSARARQPRV